MGAIGMTEKLRIKDKGSIITGIAMICTSAIFLVGSRFSHNNMYLLAYIALTVMVISGIYSVIKGFLNTKISDSNIIPNDSDEGSTSSQLNTREWLVIAVVLAISVAMMQFIGFYITAFFMLLGFHVYITKRNLKFNIIKSIVFSLIGLAVVYIVFALLLRLSLPRNVLLF
jgi:hypothetical protein